MAHTTKREAIIKVMERDSTVKLPKSIFLKSLMKLRICGNCHGQIIRESLLIRSQNIRPPPEDHPGNRAEREREFLALTLLF